MGTRGRRDGQEFIREISNEGAAEVDTETKAAYDSRMWVVTDLQHRLGHFPSGRVGRVVQEISAGKGLA